tara:strand:- start:118 stop:489 length:372 start_codon:yes stop_codon:yes gene_type:complete
MKNILFTLALLICLCSYGQTRTAIINNLVKLSNKAKGMDAGGGMILIKGLNENNRAFVYVYNTSSEETLKQYKKTVSKQFFINQSPTQFSKVVNNNNIITKWRYLYNYKKSIEVTVYPNEWNN